MFSSPTCARPEREALATVRLDPPDAADGANWLYILAWAGGDDRVVDRLEKVGNGVYRSTEPIPLYGDWKAGLRLNNGRERGAVAMRLPVDPGLPGAQQRLPAELSPGAVRPGDEALGGEPSCPRPPRSAAHSATTT